MLVFLEENDTITRHFTLLHGLRGTKDEIYKE